MPKRSVWLWGWKKRELLVISLLRLKKGDQIDHQPFQSQSQSQIQIRIHKNLINCIWWRFTTSGSKGFSMTRTRFVLLVTPAFMLSRLDPEALFAFLPCKSPELSLILGIAIGARFRPCSSFSLPSRHFEFTWRSLSVPLEKGFDLIFHFGRLAVELSLVGLLGRMFQRISRKYQGPIKSLWNSTWENENWLCFILTNKISFAGRFFPSFTLENPREAKPIVLSSSSLRKPWS